MPVVGEVGRHEDGAPEDGGGVVDIDVVIDDEDVLGPGHLTGAPDRVHDAAGLERVVLADLDERAVHLRALGGDAHIAAERQRRNADTKTLQGLPP